MIQLASYTVFIYGGMNISVSMIVFLLIAFAIVQRLGIAQSSGSDTAASSFIAQFNASEYEIDVNICSPNGTVIFEALFIINPNVTVEYLSFDILMDDMVGESSVDGGFLINRTPPPLVIQQAPFQSMYLLTLTTGNALDTNDTMDITFNLFAFINISTGILSMPASNVTLHKIVPAQFNATEYEFDVNIYSPIGTVVFEALFIIDPNVTVACTVEYLRFDIIMMDEMVGESSVDGDFLINGTIPPLVMQQAPFQSMYLLTITTGNVLDTNDTMDITLDLFAFINISTGVSSMPVSNVTLHKIDPCNECVSNSTCEPQLDGSVNCICPTGYNGTNCFNYIGVCIPNPCMNNGSCQDIPGSFTCSCPSPLSGRLCKVDDSGDSTSGSFSIIIIIAATVGAFIIVLLIFCCILIVMCKRKENKAAKPSKPTIKLMEDITDDSLLFPQGIDDPKIMQETAEAVTAQGTGEVLIENSTFIRPAKNSPINIDHADTDSPQGTDDPIIVQETAEAVTAQGTGKVVTENSTFIQPAENLSINFDHEYSYPHNTTEAEEKRVYKEKRAQFLQKITGQTTVATPDEYDDVALYEKMTRHYYNLDNSSISIKEIPRNKVKMLDQLGKGEFGRVMKGIVREMTAGEPETLVAVKLLKEGASDEIKKDFLGEAHLLSQFNHPNVLTLLGVVTVDEPVLVIIPFMKNGDLRSFLISTDDEAKLSCANKLDMAIQIANGMEYLAAKFYIHRDLAARNILVGEGFHVKISDFGMSRALAKENTYYKMNKAAKLPVKWMAIESIDYSKFSTFSDVWSFGVVLWEIFSYGRTPYKEIPNANLPAHIRSGKRLTKPADCSNEIYQLISQCWLERKERRPTFTELKKEISILLDKEGSKPDEYVYII